MTAVTLERGAGTEVESGRLSAALAPGMALARRAVLGLWRQPQTWAPAVLFPMLFAALNVAALGKAPNGISVNLFAQALQDGAVAPPANLPGFLAAVDAGNVGEAVRFVPDAQRFHPFGPENRYIDFLMVATMVQGVLFGSLAGASALAEDIETGFFDRIVSTPVARSSIVFGRLAGSAALGFVQGWLFLGLFVAFGAHIEGGWAGALVLPVAATLLSLGIGGLAAAGAIKTGSVEAVQGSFPVLFIVVFVSSAFFPTVLMKGWYQQVAEHNPLSWMINGMRHQVLYGFDLSEAAKAVGVPAALVVVSVSLCLLALKQRLASR